MSIENRRHERVKHVAKIRVVAHPDNVYTMEMRDFSESGLYVVAEDLSIVNLGDIVEVQTLEIDDAPIIPSKVVRIDSKGFGLEFLLD